MRSRLLALFLLLVAALPVFAGTTGKIAGRVRDTESGEPLVGVSVVVERTTLGASTDVDGNYTIVSVPPGTYTVAASSVGFQKKRVLNVKVSIDFTTRVDIQLATEAINLETVEVQAEAPMVRKDLTSSQTVVDASVIQSLPVENVTQVLTLQAGIIQGAGGEIHIRGGRSTEIQYSINGVSIVNPFDNSRSVQIATNAIQELSVVSGTFNAEYGNALSGVVNTVTKEGGASYRGSLSYYFGDKASSHTDVFPQADKFQPFTYNVAELTLSGPVLSDQITFFLSGRYDLNQGYLYGWRQHLPPDSLYKNPQNPNELFPVETGDSALVAMNPSRELSTTAKLAWAVTPTVKLKYDFLYSTGRYQSYIHDLKYNPEANPASYEWGMVNAVELRHALSSNAYYTLRGSYSINDFKSYLYPLLDANGDEVKFHAGMELDTLSMFADQRYQPSSKYATRATAYTFAHGGTINGQAYQRTQTADVKFDITSQLTTNHEVKGGLEYRNHRIDYRGFTVLKETRTPLDSNYVAFVPSVSTPYHSSYVRYPVEFSGYLQDKMEFDNLVLNVGLRYDYFDAKSIYSPDVYYPSPMPPGGLPPQVDSASLLVTSSGKHQWSPRLGVSFPITDRGIIHFSYGHFFQMPPFQYLYSNPEFEYNLRSGNPTFGNANLNPEKTITYELGLQQQLAEDLAINITGFYKDVRDLLALQQIRISSNETYFKYVNKDYANIRGVTFTLTKRRTASDMLGLSLDYTFQAAEGNETNVNAFFIDLSSGRQSEKIPVNLDWDQTHTLNATVSVGAVNDWNVTAVGRFGTGLPYTPQVTQQTIYLTTNSGRKPAQMVVDLMGEKSFALGPMALTLFLKVYNLFDQLNERYVYDDTGRATYTLLLNEGPAQATDKLAQEVPGIHSATEYFTRPTYYLTPREVRFGLSIDF